VLNFNLLYNEQQDRWEPQRSSGTGNSIGGFGASTALSPGFGSFFTPLPDSSGTVLIETEAQTDGNTNGSVLIDVDDSGGTTADYILTGAFADDDFPVDTNIINSQSIPLTAGASVRIRNPDDPNNFNRIRIVRAYPFE